MATTRHIKRANAARPLFEQVVATFGGDVTSAAIALGVDQETLRTWIVLEQGETSSVSASRPDAAAGIILKVA